MRLEIEIELSKQLSETGASVNSRHHFAEAEQRHSLCADAHSTIEPRAPIHENMESLCLQAQ